MPVRRLFDRRVAPDHSPAPQTALAVIHGLFWLIADLAEQAPLAVLLDDAQWCDTSSLRFLEYLLERLGELPVAIVLTRRPGRHGQQSTQLERTASHQNSRTHRVQALGLDSVSTLVRLVLKDATDAFCAACAERTAGNPFYLREVLLALRAEGESAGEMELAQVSQLEEAVDAFDQAVQLISDRHERADVQLARGRALTTQGSHLAAAQAFQAGLAELDDDTCELARELRVAYVKSSVLEVSLHELGLAGLEELEQGPGRPLTHGERSLLAQHAAHASRVCLRRGARGCSPAGIADGVRDGQLLPVISALSPGAHQRLAR
jgi:tetratricopeptide (TPR) repeat protein